MDYITANPFEFTRGRTQVGQKGYIAWIDDESRVVHVKPAKCVGLEFNGKVAIRTDDGEHTLTVPSGRLDCSPKAALDALAFDVREEGTQQLKAIESRKQALEREHADIARGMLLHLVAIEMAKAGAGDTQAGKSLAQQLQAIEYSGDE